MFVEIFCAFMFFVGIISLVEKKHQETVYVVIKEDKPKTIHNNPRRVKDLETRNRIKAI